MERGAISPEEYKELQATIMTSNAKCIFDFVSTCLLKGF